MIRPLATFALVVAASVAAVPSSAQSSREPYPGFDAYVTAALKTFDVPGAAIGSLKRSIAPRGTTSVRPWTPGEAAESVA